MAREFQELPTEQQVPFVEAEKAATRRRQCERKAMREAALSETAVPPAGKDPLPLSSAEFLESVLAASKKCSTLEEAREKAAFNDWGLQHHCLILHSLCCVCGCAGV